MIKLTKVIGNLDSIKDSIESNITLHKISLEWYEAYKRIGRFTSHKGLDVAICFEAPLIYGLNDGDILHVENGLIIAIEIIPCDVLSIIATKNLEIAKLCYEIGNNHIPLFYENTFLIPYEKTLESSLQKMGFSTKKELRKLNAKNRFFISHPLKQEPRLKISADLKINCKVIQ